ncbi:MAG: phosphotransferase [Ectothiorhodospiraceae bacterium]|nr:phosphotransferase [Ectothiorhodospiraceae bacterium]
MTQEQVVPGAGDARLQALAAWLLEQGVEADVLEPASSDASFRRYFRVRTGGGSRIVMDAPPPREDCRPFVQVADLMRDAGVHVPEVLAQDLERGFLLLSDLGRHTYLDVLSADNAAELYSLAVDALLRWQVASREGVLPEYDEALLRREMALFPEWYLERHLGLRLPASERDELERYVAALVERALAQPRVFVHRDYMPRNLMISNPMPGVLDFQDAVYGPVSYDPVCLFMDAFISWPADQVGEWLADYWRRAGIAGVPVPTRCEQFLSDCRWMGVQRHLKVIGIFARIRHRDGKPRYLEDVGRFFDYLSQAAEAEPELRGLMSLVAHWRKQAGNP